MSNLSAWLLAVQGIVSRKILLPVIRSSDRIDPAQGHPILERRSRLGSPSRARARRRNEANHMVLKAGLAELWGRGQQLADFSCFFGL